jgi:hypothetical protein
MKKINNKPSNKKKIKASGVKRPQTSKKRILKIKKSVIALDVNNISEKEQNDFLSNGVIMPVVLNDNLSSDSNSNRTVTEELDVSNNKIKNEPAKYLKIKKVNILCELLKRNCGANMEELSEKLNWKKSSLRGVLSNLQKQHRFTLLSLNISKSNLDTNSDVISFEKETRYFIKEANFDLSSFLTLD